MAKKLCLILGDQLSHELSSLDYIEKTRDIVVLCEVWQEATYVKHHKKKIAFLFSAMRHFARELSAKGYTVHYHKLDVSGYSSFTEVVSECVKQEAITEVFVTEPGEYRVLEEIKTWKRVLGIPVEILPDRRFLCDHHTFANWASGRKTLRMEYFYRMMRKELGLLLDGAKPEGGKWNYDADNRKPAPDAFAPPDPLTFEPDAITQDVLQVVDAHFLDHFGDVEPFNLAVTRTQALEALDHFIEYRLPSFGDYQDAMMQGKPWMSHSVLSFYLNCGLLYPIEVAKAAEVAYHAGHAPLNAVEGFIRQIIGWREYVRGIYWLHMPEYRTENVLNASRALPDFFWTADTRMNCLKQCITETRRHAYAHHIQRLMVLGNFALLAGLHPGEVNEWYLVVYADAYEWVELPNVTGMVLYADGGLLASKPYAAGGAYINRMSDYCKGCSFNVKKKNGAEACPFNYLYWDFLMRNRKKLEGNPRLAMPYRTLQRMSEEEVRRIEEDARLFLDSLA